ncbi:MAG TPA: hypothetical protein VN654_23510, partial [Vicinamibacterales bacterium]|nr:hypothetical protein [Vicinamibacterales bacterium]
MTRKAGVAAAKVYAHRNERSTRRCRRFARHNKTACYLSHLGIHDITIGEDDPADTPDRRAVLGH